MGCTCIRMYAHTETCSGLTVNVCVGYSGSEDICRAAEAISQTKRAPGSLSPDDFLPYLQLSSPIDLLVRTSGETRLSNFALYNVAYSELLFVDKPWPEFGKDDFQAAIDAFDDRDRRFGK